MDFLSTTRSPAGSWLTRSVDPGYFATGTDTLTSREALAAQPDDELGELLEFIQIRVLLSAADVLEPVLRAILDRPSFRYQRIRGESIGVIRGRLDTVTYLRRRHERSAPRRFPVVSVTRSHLLPENVLATWAALTVAGALRRLPLHRLPSDAPERRRAERTTESLRRLVQHPAFAECTEAASDIWRKNSQPELVESVRGRLRGGRMPSGACYEALADWASSYSPNEISLEDGKLPWLFYDETFDTRLFELWSLNRLVVALTDRLGLPTTTRLLVERSAGPIAEWTIGAVMIQVWYQAGLARIDVGDPRWAYAPRDRDRSRPDGAFGGVPDISVVVQQPGQARRPVILDPKLRQRKSVPGAELYKLIGYFGNLPADHPSRGAIIFHGPNGEQRSYRIADGGSGEILAVAVDPLDAADAAERFADLAEFVMKTIPPSTMTRAVGPVDPDDDDSIEVWVDTVQSQAVQEMSAAISPDNLERSRKALRANLLETWDRLDEDTQRMLATAEHFGGSVTPDMDHSGPMLGLAAACERIIRLYVLGLGVSVPSKLTFGQLLRIADDAASSEPGGPHDQMRSALEARGVSLPDLHGLTTDLFRLNEEYRIPAAHADVLEEGDWFSGRAAILVGADAALPRVVKVLGV